MVKQEYNNIIAFHPGYYLRDILDDLEMSQEEFARRLAVSGKTVSCLLNGKTPITKDLAMRLSFMLGMSEDVFLNLQKTYDEKVIEIEKKKSAENQSVILEWIDYDYFVENGFLEKTSDNNEKIKKLCEFLRVSDLTVLKRKDLFACFRTEAGIGSEKRTVNANVWVQTALNVGSEIQTETYDEKKLNAIIPRIRALTLLPFDEAQSELQLLFKSCGVAFVLLPSMKNARVDGVVKWYNGRAVLAVSTGFSYVDSFWFTLFHEIKHVLQKKVTKIIVGNSEADFGTDETMESEADAFAAQTLISQSSYDRFISENEPHFSRECIFEFSKNEGIHPGITVGRLVHDNKIPYSAFSDLREKFTIAL